MHDCSIVLCMEDRQPKMFAFLCATLPDMNDYRFLFDLARLHKAVTHTGEGDIPPSFATPLSIPLASAYQGHHRRAGTLFRVHRHAGTRLLSTTQLRPPQSFLADLLNLDVKWGNRVFIYCTNHGSTQHFALTKRNSSPVTNYNLQLRLYF